MSETLSDLELTKLCAEAMGYMVREQRYDSLPVPKDAVCVGADGFRGDFVFNPLHDDRDAMKLLKRFRPHVNANEQGSWWVLVRNAEAKGPDLNRAIVECIAYMQRSKAR